MAYRLPPEAYQLAETYHLGKPTAMYDTDFKSQLNTLLSVSGCVLTFFFPFVLCKNNFKFDFHSLLFYGIAIGCVLVACLFIFIVTIVPRIPSRDVRVYVCTDGLIYKKQQDVEVVRWDDIERIDYSTILFKNGTKTRINRYINFNALERNIKRRMKRYRQIQHISNVEM
jgi:hypothetical protein